MTQGKMAQMDGRRRLLLQQVAAVAERLEVSYDHNLEALRAIYRGERVISSDLRAKKSSSIENRE